MCEKGSSAMNFESMYADVGVEASPREESNESGTTLKAHDYIGLSEVSSANSSNEGHPERGRSEVLDLNESATVLRLGPPAAPRADATAAAAAAAGGAGDVRAREVGKSAVGGSQRNNAILEEFRKAQAMKAATQHAARHAPQAQMMKSGTAEMAMYQRAAGKGYEGGQKGGYPAACFQGAYNAFPGAKNYGLKRGYSETMGMHVGGGGREDHGVGKVGEGMGVGGSEQGDVKVMIQQGKMWMGNGSHNGYNVQKRSSVQDAGDSSKRVSNEAKKVALKEAMGGGCNNQAASPAQTQTVGWPPVKSFVRNNNPVKPAPPPPAPASACPSVQGKDTPSSTNSTSCLVKIYMDGVPFGRKVDLKTNNEYEKLYPALEEMFQQFIGGHHCGSQSSSSTKSQFGSSSSRKLNFLDGSEYVLIYEDHEGDFMLVGDVPWELFVSTVKRLRIMKGSEQVNLGSKSADAVKTQPAVG